MHDSSCVDTFTLDGEQLSSIVFAPNGKSVIAGCNSGVISIWNLESRENQLLECTMVRVTSREYPGDYNRIWQVSLSPDGSKLAAGCGDATIKLWDLRTQEQHILAGHSDQVRAVGFAKDGELLVSGCRDGAVKVWDVATLREIRQLHGHRTGVRNLDVFGTKLATAAGDASFRIWQLEDVEDEDLFASTPTYVVRTCTIWPSRPMAGTGRSSGTSHRAVRNTTFRLDTEQFSEPLLDEPTHEMEVSSRGTLAAILGDGRLLIADLTQNGELDSLAEFRNVTCRALRLTVTVVGSYLGAQTDGSKCGTQQA